MIPANADMQKPTTLQNAPKSLWRSAFLMPGGRQTVPIGAAQFAYRAFV